MRDYALYRVNGMVCLILPCRARVYRRAGLSCERMSDDEVRAWQQEQERRRAEMVELLRPIAERLGAGEVGE